MRLTGAELRSFLEEKLSFYNTPSFITDDPISIPHRFFKKQDIEISGFLTATISWGQRPVILKNASTLLKRMDDSPHDFILNFKKKDLLPFKNFVHRTFNGVDCLFFLQALQKIYLKHDSLEEVFKASIHTSIQPDYRASIAYFRKLFFKLPYPQRTLKHFANPDEGSSAKRLNMFLRWMIRKDSCGVDFGIWNLQPSMLTCPLDVHSGRVARKLNLLKRKQNDWKAAAELTDALKKMDANDPVKYDFALFGLGVFEKL
jgi:uncharacterized protein (TIGR02757 family)